MKPLAIAGKSRRRHDHEAPTPSDQAPRAEPIPSYLQNPEGLRAPLPEVSPLAAPVHPPVSPELAAALRRVQWRRSLAPPGAGGRNASGVLLREHRVHSRGR